MFPVRLETERLVLREFVPADLDAMQAYASDPEVVRYEAWGPNTPEQDREFLSSVILAGQRSEPRGVYELAIELNGSLAGGCGLRIQDALTRTASLGYVLTRAHWGKGYMPEAAAALVGFGFGTLGIRRIQAKTDTRNARSRRVLEKLGMRFEGLQKADQLRRGEWADSYLYALLDGEWLASGSPARRGPTSFPEFARNAANRVARASQFTSDVEGYVFDGADGSQVALWTSLADRTSAEHVHDFDEYVLVVAGQAVVIAGDERTVLGPGMEKVIPRGTRQRMAVAAGTRTIHVFGGKRARRQGDG